MEIFDQKLKQLENSHVIFVIVTIQNEKRYETRMILITLIRSQINTRDLNTHEIILYEINDRSSIIPFLSVRVTA